MTCAMSIRGVTASEKLLLLALANYADENMRCFPSQGRLAEDACLTPRTIRSTLLALEQRGIISREQRKRADGSRTSDIITLHLYGEPCTPRGGEMISGGGEMISGGVGKWFPGGAEIISGLTTYEPVSEPVKLKREARATRLPEAWAPPDQDWKLAVDRLGDGGAKEALASFCDYWRAVPGAKGRKLDWGATFRNWVRREKPRAGSTRPKRVGWV